MRLLSTGPGRAAVVITHNGGPLHIADVTYGEAPAETRVEWNDDGHSALERYKLDYWSSRIYPALARWRSGR